SDFPPRVGALALARHLRLVHAALPVEIPLPGDLPLVPRRRIPRRGALRRADPDAGHEGVMSVERPLAAMGGARDACLAAAPIAPPAPRIVALGGGTGVSVLLRGLKEALFPAEWPWLATRDQDRLTAVVTAADDGGSSGRLRDAYRLLPLGDLR